MDVARVVAQGCSRRASAANSAEPTSAWRAAVLHKAESNLYRSWGMDVIGMTNLQEAKLAREAEICYATVAMVTGLRLLASRARRGHRRSDYCRAQPNAEER